MVKLQRDYLTKIADVASRGRSRGKFVESFEMWQAWAMAKSVNKSILMDAIRNLKMRCQWKAFHGWLSRAEDRRPDGGVCAVLWRQRAVWCRSRG